MFKLAGYKLRLFVIAQWLYCIINYNLVFVLQTTKNRLIRALVRPACFRVWFERNNYDWKLNHKKEHAQSIMVFWLQRLTGLMFSFFFSKSYSDFVSGLCLMNVWLNICKTWEEARLKKAIRRSSVCSGWLMIWKYH